MTTFSSLLPPPIISNYLWRAYLLRFVMLLISITVVLQILDLLTDSEDILSVEGSTYASILRYIELRFPQLLSEFVPFTALLAAILTYTTLNQGSEIVVMKAAGLSAYQVIAPLVVVSAGIGLVHFIFNEAVVTRATAELRHWQKNGYALDAPPAPDGVTQTWVLDGTNLVEVASVARSGRMLVVDDVTVYVRNGEGRLQGVTKADFATYQDGGWTMFDVRHFDIATQLVGTEAKTTWDTGIAPERFLALAVIPEQVSFGSLVTAMAELEREGYPMRSLSASLNHKIASPMATLLMPLLAALAAFGVVRGGQLFIRIAMAMAFGFSYFIIDNLMLAMGQFGRIPPELAAWAPFFLFLGAGLLVVVYTED